MKREANMLLIHKTGIKTKMKILARVFRKFCEAMFCVNLVLKNFANSQESNYEEDHFTIFESCYPKERV